VNKEALAHLGAVVPKKTKHTHNKYRPINPGFVNQIMPYLAYLVLYASKRQFLLIEWS